MTLVRVAGIEDVAAVARLEAECLGQDAWSEGLVREGISGALPTVTYLVAESDGVVVGHAVTSAAGDIAELQRIAVGEDRRRTGVASALLARVVEDASRTEADRLLLEVREDNRGALAFYAERGLRRDRPAAALLRRRLDRRGAAARARARGGGRDG